MNWQIKRRCHKCNGEGVLHDVIVGEGEFIEVDPCPCCGGEGSITLRDFVQLPDSLFDDIEDKLDDIMDKCNDIFEKVNE